MLRNSLLCTAVLAAMVATTGCSNSSSSSSDSAETTLSGNAADGYLAGAKVCLDLNENGACDDGEPSATTGTNGAFTLDDVTQEQIDTYPLVVEIIVGETIDEDNPGEAITRVYSLTAPAGSTFISPLTTMIQNEIREQGVSAEEAKERIRTRLGTDIDPSADYVAGADDETNGDEYARLHKVAQVTRALIQNNRELIEQVAGDAEISPDDLIAMIMNQVLAALADIQTAIENAGEDFDPDALAGDDSLSGANLNAGDIEDEIQNREDQKSATAANLATLVSGDGLYYFDSDDGYFTYGHVVDDGEGTIVNTQYEFSSYMMEEPGWSEITEDSPEEDCYPTASGWTCVSDSDETVTADGSNLSVIRGGVAETEEIISATEVDLSGKRIAGYARDSEYEDVLNPTATFSTDAKGYRLTITRSSTLYSIYKNETFSMGETVYCMDETTIGEEPGDSTDDWCNNVFGTTDDMPVATLNGLLSATATESMESRYDLPVFIDISGMEGGDKESGYWHLELVTGGAARFWTQVYDYETETISYEVAYTTTWSYQTVNSQQLLVVNYPAAVLAEGYFDKDLQGIFFAVAEGYVRRGDIIKSGSYKDDQWAFNSIAGGDILAAFDYELRYDLDFYNDYDQEDATSADFVSAVDDYGTYDFTGNVTLAGIDFQDSDGIISLAEDGSGTYVGEVNDAPASLTLSWELTTDSNGYEILVINTSTSDSSGTTYMRLTAALVEANARQVSLLLFSQEAATEAALDDASGEIYGEVWDIR